jgi:hypothetical protein
MKQTLRGFASAVAAADGTTSVSQSSKHADAAAPVGSAMVVLVEPVQILFGSLKNPRNKDIFRIFCPDVYFL